MTPECLEYNNRNDFKCNECTLMKGDCGKELDQCDTVFTGLDMQSDQCINCHLYNVVMWARQERGEQSLVAQQEDEAERGYEAMEKERPEADAKEVGG